jgi:hypothetical protein
VKDVKDVKMCMNLDYNEKNYCRRGATYLLIEGLGCLLIDTKVITVLLA